MKKVAGLDHIFGDPFNLFCIFQYPTIIVHLDSLKSKNSKERRPNIGP